MSIVISEVMTNRHELNKIGMVTKCNRLNIRRVNE
jgi:hypothetical protein